MRNFFFSELGIRVSYFEIYCGKLYDLLNNREQITAREDSKQNIQIIGLSKTPVGNTEDVVEMISKGN